MAGFLQFRNSLVIVSLGVMAVALLLATLGARRITGPVRTLVGLVERARDGSYSGAVAVHTGDEIGVLARAFNGLLAELREKEQLIQYLNEGMTQMKRAEAQQTLSASDETAAIKAVSAQAGVQVEKGQLFAGRYEVLGTLGKGGMGIVYRAEDKRLDEVVALKVLRPEVLENDPTLLQRFKEELRLARRITHKNVLRTHDFDVTQDGTPYISMEYLEGVTLKELVQSKGALPVGVGLRIAKQMCAGLNAAHQQGVVHRDIKPHNMLIIPETGELKIMDFGIARRSEVHSDGGLTTDGMVMGTPDYMAPEQAQGRPADFRSDLYALGVVLFEVFTGRLPFQGETVMATVLKHIQEPAPDPRRANPRLPEDLARLILRCLEKDPGARFQRAGDIHKELTAVSSRQAGPPPRPEGGAPAPPAGRGIIPACPSSPQSRLANLALAAATFVGLALALEGGARWLERRQPRPKVAAYLWNWERMWQGEFYTLGGGAAGWPPEGEVNADGLRDRPHPVEKPPRTFRLAFLGDSVTMGHGLPATQAYPRVLQEELDREGWRVEVLSVALQGWSTRQQRLAWERLARRYQPDLVVLAVCLNDVPELQNNLSRPPVWLSWLHRRSALARRAVDAGGREIASVEELFEQPAPRRVQEGWRRFFEEVRGLRDEVRAGGSRLAVWRFPSASRCGPGPRRRWRSSSLAAFCRQEGLELLDLLPALQPQGEAAFIDYDHLSLLGARSVAAALRAQGWIPTVLRPARAARARAGPGRGPARRRRPGSTRGRGLFLRGTAVPRREAGAPPRGGSRPGRARGGRGRGPRGGCGPGPRGGGRATASGRPRRPQPGRALGGRARPGQPAPVPGGGPAPADRDARLRGRVHARLCGPRAGPARPGRRGGPSGPAEGPGRRAPPGAGGARDRASGPQGQPDRAPTRRAGRLWARAPARAAAARALGWLRGAARPAIPALVETLRSGPPDARADAARALGRIGLAEPVVLAALEAALAGDGDTRVRVLAARALGWLGAVGRGFGARPAASPARPQRAPGRRGRDGAAAPGGPGARRAGGRVAALRSWLLGLGRDAAPGRPRAASAEGRPRGPRSEAVAQPEADQPGVDLDRGHLLPAGGQGHVAADGHVLDVGVEEQLLAQLHVAAGLPRHPEAGVLEVELSDAGHGQVDVGDQGQVDARPEVGPEDALGGEVVLQRQRRRQVLEAAQRGAAQLHVVLLRVGQDQLGRQVPAEEVGEVDLGDGLAAHVDGVGGHAQGWYRLGLVRRRDVDGPHAHHQPAFFGLGGHGDEHQQRQANLSLHRSPPRSRPAGVSGGRRR